ncbi:BnaA02g23900D [Brassica napus]|uniref:BnaA02g23900D protein n=1 Tax=Brassica napus TaxID=3708 RepID=A0A078GIR0_BRANA|nr:BnaA02g23900D [Brassica napus]
MAANLTAGAIGKMLNGEVTEKEMTPIVQVTELKLIQQARKNQESMERYKLSLSDGFQSQEGILNNTLNLLVTQGKIQIGSVLRLTHFVTNSVQTRRIVIVMELEIIAEQCNIIGNPLPAHPGKPRNSDQTQQQPGAVSVNTQSNGRFEQQQQATRSELNGAVRHGSAQQHQVGERRAFGTASEFPETTTPSARPFASSNAAYGSSRQVQTRPSPSPPVQSGYQAQPPSIRAFGTASEFPETTTPSARPFASSNAAYGSSRQVQTRPSPSPPVQSGYQAQPPSMYANMGPVARNEAPPTVVPISALNPYQNRPLGGVTLCDACGSNAHVFANCPSFLSEPQGQHMNSAYGNTPGRNAGGGMPRQHVGSY